MKSLLLVLALLMPSPGRRARTILVADDSPLMRKMLCDVFEAEEDYDICAEATNGQEALDLALKHRPVLIILDSSKSAVGPLFALKKTAKGKLID